MRRNITEASFASGHIVFKLMFSKDNALFKKRFFLKCSSHYQVLFQHELEFFRET